LGSRRECIQTAGSIDVATQTAPVVQTLGSGNQDTHTAATASTTPKSPSPTGAANKHFGDGLGWQLRFGLVVLVSAVLVL
jgi:hypothetical protein